MKRIVAILLALGLVILALPVSGCEKKENGLTLNICNWEDYISDEGTDVIEEFEKYYKEKYGKEVTVKYSTFGTNENMYNELKLAKSTNDKGEVDYGYDLVCPSDYMIQKMISENMLEKFDSEKLDVYNANASPFIKNIFKTHGGETLWSDYAACYMWGTMGFVYSDNAVGFADENGNVSWGTVWQEKYAKKATIKDSVRDSYILALGYIYADELNAILSERPSDMAAKLEDIFNRADSTTIQKSGDAFKALVKNLYGFEVDSGKKDMVTGKIDVNFAWSGDAVFSLDTAEEDGVYLHYSVPTEGSNIWFDGWVMPKGADTDLATEFINFLSTPEMALANMNYIGYTSSIATEELFDNAADWYGVSSLYESETTKSEYDAMDKDDKADYELIGGKVYEYGYAGKDVTKVGDKYTLEQKYVEGGELKTQTIEVYPDNLQYYFDGMLESEDYIIFAEEENRQLFAQYPDETITERCAIMRMFSDEENDELLKMWESVKTSKLSVGMILLIIAAVVLVIGAVVLIIFLKKKNIKLGKNKSKGKLVSKTEIK